MTAQAGIGLDHGPGPLPAIGLIQSLRDSAVLTSAFVESAIVSVARARRATLYIAYSAVTSASNARAQFIVCVSGTKVAPAIGADSWYTPAVIDAVATDAVMTGSVPSGFDQTVTPEFRNYAIGPASFTTIAVDNATDKIRIALPIDVTGAKWMVLLAKELGDTSHPGTFAVDYVLSL